MGTTVDGVGATSSSALGSTNTPQGMIPQGMIPQGIDTTSDDESHDVSTVTRKEVNRKFNRAFGMDMDAQWYLCKGANGYKCVPDCQRCLINTGRLHSKTGKSAVFFNNDRSVVLHCWSCGTRAIMDKPEAKKLFTQFNVIINVQGEENNTYQNLVQNMIDVAATENLLREEESGVVFKPVDPSIIYAYVRYMEPRPFLNKLFMADRDFRSNVNNMDKLTKFLKEFDDETFSFIKIDKNYIGFQNGVLNIVSLVFTPKAEIDSKFVVRKYFPVDFTHSLDTPLFDAVLNYQFTPEVRDFVYFFLGRLFGIRDTYQFMPLLMGLPGCGKSLIIEVMCECFDKVGAIGTTFEEKFGLGNLYDKELIVCDDLPKDIARILPQQTFQSMVSLGKVPVAIKGKLGFTVDWDIPMIWASNFSLSSYLDKGQISRRVVVANFERMVTAQDPSLKSRILKSELPAIIYKSLLKYKNILDAHQNESVWDFCPQYFKDQQDDMRTDCNPLFRFLVQNTEFKENESVSLEEIKQAFQQWLGKKTGALDYGTFTQVNQKFTVKKINACRACLKHHSKGCCDKYARTNRSCRTIVENISLIA